MYRANPSYEGSENSYEEKEQYPAHNQGKAFYLGDNNSAYYGYEPKQHKFKSWLAKHRKAVFAGLVVLAMAIIGAVLGGVLGSQSSSNSSSNGSSSGAGGNGGGAPATHGNSMQALPGSAGVVMVDPRDTSKFQTDDRLKRSFFGLAYTPMNSVPPNCYAVQNNVTEDVILMSQLSTQIRTYASSCNQTNMVLQAIQDTKVNLSVYLGVYVSTNETVNQDQFDTTIQALKTYGVDHVSGITVGNEFILDAPDNSMKEKDALNLVLKKVQEMKDALQQLNLPKTIPVGTADAGSVISPELVEGVDYVMANVHPWFGKVPIAQAAGWTNDFFTNNDLIYTQNATKHTDAFIAETGWPTNSMTSMNITNGGAHAGEPELQTFLDTFVCQANKNQTGYFYFEVFDEPWKRMYGGVEPYWGLFDSNKNLKNVKIPDCVIW